MDFKLRAVQKKDFTTIASWVPDAKACQYWAGPNLEFPFTPDILPTLLGVTANNSFSLVNAANDAIGFGQITFSTINTVHLARIIVASSWRGLGIGYVLCERLIAKARQSFGASKITLRVYPDNLAAIKLYTRLGFVTVGSDCLSGVLLMEYYQKSESCV